MNYCIIRIQCLAYNTVLAILQSKYPDLSKYSYKDQQGIVFREKLVHSDGFSKSFNILGNEAHEIIADFEIAQKTWAMENGLKYDQENWKHEIVLKQIESLRPDIVYFQDTNSIHLETRKDLKILFPFIKLIIIQKGYPGHTHQDFTDADLLFVSSPILFDAYKNLNPYLIYHSFDNSVLNDLQIDANSEKEIKNEFVFIGSSRIIAGGEFPESRYYYLKELIANTNILIWEYEVKRSFALRLKLHLRSALKYGISILNGNLLNNDIIKFFSPNLINKIILELLDVENKHHWKINELPVKTLAEDYPDRCQEPVFGIDMYKILNGSRFLFINHADKAENTVDNMKMFECTGVGSCLLTDTGSNMQDLFEPDKEVVTYSSVDEAIEKVKYLLVHPDEVEQIAKAGQARTLKNHTIMNRCQQIDEIIQTNL